MRRTCSNHDQTLLTPCSNQILIKVNYIGRSPGLPATVFKPYLITEIWRCPGLLESIINQIQYVQTCVCVNVGRGAGLPETMFLLCLITELGHGPSLLEEVAHTRTHAPTLSPKPAPTPTPTPVLTPTPTPTDLDFLQCGFRHQITK